MSHRQARRSNGRFTRNTPENTFGLHVQACPECRMLSAWAVGTPKPATCHACGADLGSDS